MGKQIEFTGDDWQSYDAIILTANLERKRVLLKYLRII